MVPASFSYSGSLAASAAHAVTAGIKNVPQVAAANEVGGLIESLRTKRDALVAAIKDSVGTWEQVKHA